MRLSRSAFPLLLLATAVALAACSSAQQTFGLGKRSPDEFAVVRRAPLVIPPDSTLRPPQPGAPPTAEVAPAVAARDALLGSAASQVPVDNTQSAGEQAILGDTKITALPDIRTVITDENTQLAVLDRGTFLAILGWQAKRQQPQPNVVDPLAESRRLAAEGLVSTTRTGTTLLTSPDGG